MITFQLNQDIKNKSQAMWRDTNLYIYLTWDENKVLKKEILCWKCKF